MASSAILCVGDSGSGKSSLLAKFRANDDEEATRSRAEVLTYDYMVLADPNDNEKDVEDLDSKNLVSIWSANERTMRYMDDSLLDANSFERLLVIICLDLSSPTTCVASLRRWLNIIRHKRQAWRDASSRITAVAAGGGGGGGGAQASSQAWDVPIVVVACKADLIHSSDVASAKTTKILQGQLRALCLSTDASLVYVSASTSSNCSTLQKMLGRMLYPELYESEASLRIEDGASDAVIPVGLDSPELITIATDVKVDLKEIEMQLSNEQDTIAPGRQSGDSNASADSAATGASGGKTQPTTQSQAHELEDEQEWLTGLHSIIAATTSTDDGSTSAPSAAASSAAASAGSTGAPVATPAATKPAVRSRLKVQAQPQAKDTQQATDFFKNLLGPSGSAKK